MYYYEILRDPNEKTIGTKRYIVVYKEDQKIYTGVPTAIEDNDDVLFEEALTLLEPTYTDIRANIKRKSEKYNNISLTIKPNDYTFNVGTYTNLSFQGVTDVVYKHLERIDPNGYSSLWVEFNKLREDYWNFENPVTQNGTIPKTPTWEDGVQYRQVIINKANQILSLTSAPNNLGTNTQSNQNGTGGVSDTGTTAFNSPPGHDDMKNKKTELKDKINKLQEIGLPSTKDIGKQIWENMISPKLLTPRQIAKKMLLLQGQKMNPPLTEEDAQLIVYGKVYYKDGELYDNDWVEDLYSSSTLKKFYKNKPEGDIACVSLPSDEDYEPPVDETHPLWQKIENMLNEIKDGLLQLGIKLGEFLFALPQAFAVMITSLIALVSSLVILPFGSGLPSALTAVQTMIAALKSLQQKTAEILPLIAIIDVISLILPKEAQAVIVQINVVIGIFMGILTTLIAVLGILDTVMSAFKSSKETMDNQELKIEPKIENVIVSTPTGNVDGIKLSANATGSDWGATPGKPFVYQWKDPNNNVIPKDPKNEKDDGTRIITPRPSILATFKCKVTDSKGTIKEGSIDFIV